MQAVGCLGSMRWPGHRCSGAAPPGAYPCRREPHGDGHLPADPPAPRLRGGAGVRGADDARGRARCWPTAPRAGGHERSHGIGHALLVTCSVVGGAPRAFARLRQHSWRSLPSPEPPKGLAEPPRPREFGQLWSRALVKVGRPRPKVGRYHANATNLRHTCGQHNGPKRPAQALKITQNNSAMFEPIVWSERV